MLLTGSRLEGPDLWAERTDTRAQLPHVFESRVCFLGTGRVVALLQDDREGEGHPQVVLPQVVVEYVRKELGPSPQNK